MSSEMISFAFLAFFGLGGIFMMLRLRKVIHMLLAVAFTFLSIAGLFALLGAEFVAMVQVIIYAGATTILAVFGIMLTKHTEREESNVKIGQRLFALLVLLLFLGSFYLILSDVGWMPQAADFAKNDNIRMIGTMLFNQYVIPFELISLLLLITLVGAILLAREDRNE